MKASDKQKTAAVEVPVRAYATFSKDGMPRLRSWFRFWREQPSTIDHFFTPGSWELELALADGRMQRFPFVVTADEPQPVLNVRFGP